MEIAKSGPYLVLKLEHGEDVLRSIEDAARGETGTLFIATGIGMLSDFELGYFDRGSYIRRTFLDPHELLSMQGSIASSGEPRIHIHATVADKEHRAFGGHLMRGSVWMSNEIALLRLQDLRSSRMLDPAKGVAVLHYSQ